MESTDSPALALYETDHGGQGPEEGDGCYRTRTSGFHLGHWGKSRASLSTIYSRVKTKAKTFPTKEKTKTLNNALNSRTRSAAAGASTKENPRPGSLRQACGWICVSSQRQLPTDHDYAVPPREYQLDQSSPLPATAAADPVLEPKRRPAHLDRSLHINFRIGGYSTGTPGPIPKLAPNAGNFPAFAMV